MTGGPTRGGSRGSSCCSPRSTSLWSIVPILVAIRFSFNEGRSRSTAQGLVASLVHGGSRSLGAPRSRAELGPRAEPAAGGDRRARHGSARGRARDRVDALARSRRRNVTCRLARDARHARDRHGDGAAPRLRPPADVRPARNRRAGDRAHHLLARLRRDHRPRPAARDRAAVRGGRSRPRRVSAPGGSTRAAADARSGDRRERDHRLRDLDGRLRDQRVPVLRHVDRHRARADLLHGPDRAHARAERTRDVDARAHDRHRARRLPAVARACARRAARRGRRSASSPRSTPRRFARGRARQPQPHRPSARLLPCACDRSRRCPSRPSGSGRRVAAGPGRSA